MIVVAGSCTVKLDGSEESQTYTEGDTFNIRNAALTSL